MIYRILFLDELKHSPTIFVACSGGIDSMVLLDILKKSALPIKVLHCNFQLRGADSDKDEVFLSKYCENNGIPITVKRFDTQSYRKNEKQSIQEIARKLRYAWFAEILSENDHALLCTAHHADDHEEQLWLRLLSSGRLLDLGGIPEKRGQIRRPLLNMSKMDIAEYALQHRIDWREDSSNSKSEYTRNKIRLSLIPLLHDIDPRYSKAVERLRSEIDLLKKQSSTIVKNTFGNAPSKGEFFVKSEFWENQLFVVKEILLEKWFGSNSIQAEVERFFQRAKIGACLELKNEFYILREKDGLWFGNNQLDYFDSITISTTPKKSSEDSRLEALVSEILGQEDLSAYENNQLCIQRIQMGEQVHFTNGNKRSVKKIFNDRSWPFMTRRKALGICCNNLIIEVIDRSKLQPLKTDKNHNQT